MKERLVNDRYRIIVPDHIADWDAPSEWERQRFLSMEKHLNKGDILYDIGAEQGWQSAIYAQFVGGENMVLVEPDEKAWPNIRQTWEANNLKEPNYCFVGCLGKKGNQEIVGEPFWPKESKGEIQVAFGYSSLSGDSVTTNLDELVFEVGQYPNAITIDVEGAELEVLVGSSKTLTEKRPKLWISVHPDLMENDYNTNESELRKFLRSAGYGIEDLGWDGHETHFFCVP